MVFVFTGKSALEYWLNGTDKYDNLSLAHQGITNRFEYKIDDKSALNFAKEYGLSLPISLLAPENRERNAGENYRLYVFSKHFPYRSFVKLNDRGNAAEKVFVVCPELAFIYAAEKLPLCLAVQVGCMLCAEYVRDDNEIYKQRNRNPITSVNKIKRYVEKAKNVRGIRKARIAIQYVSDNCNSPMEVNLATIAKLPIHKGGYGLHDFEMNAMAILKPEGANLIERKVLHCDIVWNKEKVAAEYESDLTHLDKGQFTYDKKRTTALTISGYRVINITKNNIATFSGTDDLFFLIRKSLRKRPINKQFDTYQEMRRENYLILFKEKKSVFKTL